MAIVHFVNRPRSQNKAGMLFVLRYCMLDKKTIDTDGRKYVTGINCTPQSAYTEFLSTKRLHQKDDGRQYYHFVQSFPIGEDMQRTERQVGNLNERNSSFLQNTKTEMTAFMKKLFVTSIAANLIASSAVLILRLIFKI